jgi:hypothetical protein
MVPANAASIRFLAAYGGPPGGILDVTLGGQNIAFSAIGTGSGATIMMYGGNIPSDLAGQSEQLTFLAPPETGNNGWIIDDIQFSTNPIPEPGTCALILCGALLFGFSRWRRK